MDAVRFKRPVLVVKIDNAPKARPQIGLNQADVVFEEGVEGGITRFAALFHSQDSMPVGPVRSARSIAIKIVSALHRPPDSVPPPSLYTWRSLGQAASGPATRPVTHARLWWQGASKATEALWDWDATARGWRRTENGEPHVDAAGRQLTPPNVVVQFVTYHDTGLVDSSGTSVPEADVVGEGDAWVLTGGMLIPCRWSKPSNGEITRYVDASGAEVRLAPGQTWVELVPPNQGEAS